MKKKNIEMLNNTLGNIVHKFSIQNKLKLMGSNSLRGILFPSDYDFVSKITEPIKALSHHFQELFSKPLPFIFLDFKSGSDKTKEDNKLRWTPKDLSNGYVIIHKKKKTLEEAMKEDMIIKLDYAVQIGNSFFENSIIFNTPYQSQKTKKQIENDLQEDISTISSNQIQDSNTRIIYLITSIFIFIMSIIYFKFGKSFKSESGGVSTFFKSFFNGLFGSFTILIIPILWVFNFTLGLQYFYLYPIFLIIIRFIRYFGTMILYFSTKNSSKASFSDELIKELDNIKNYSPSWGLIGVQELKTILAMFGYENLFSKSIIPENNNSSNLTNNKFISSGFLPNFLIENNSGGMILSIVITLLTIVISFIILFGITGIQNIS